MNDTQRIVLDIDKSTYEDIIWFCGTVSAFDDSAWNIVVVADVVYKRKFTYLTNYIVSS